MNGRQKHDGAVERGEREIGQKSAFQRHFTMNQDAVRILAKELTGEQFKVLMLMLADLDYEN
ncbi:hypothetical protein OH428_26920, partial [Escherichia coli]